MKKHRLLAICHELNLQVLLLSARHFDHEIPDDQISKLICSEIDLSIKENNQRLPEDLKLLLRKVSHIGSWYSDDYAPYCGQNQVKCSMPRMLHKDYGHQCPECKNEISFSGIRLKDSPLNYRLTIEPGIGKTPKELSLLLEHEKTLFDKISLASNYFAIVSRRGSANKINDDNHADAMIRSYDKTIANQITEDSKHYLQELQKDDFKIFIDPNKKT